MKRKYIGFIKESWEENDKYIERPDFNIAFDKDEILKFCIRLAKRKKETNIKDNYEVYIIIYEFASERYQFEYEYGLVKYVNNTIQNPGKDMYDKLLKCLDFNYFKYDLCGNLLESHPEFIYPINGSIHFNSLDASILEENCIESFDCNLMCLHYDKFNNENENYNVFTDNYLYNIYIERVPYDETDSGYEEISSLIGCKGLDFVKEDAARELLSNAHTSYMNDTDEKDISDEKLLQLINDNFINYSVEIFIITYNRYDKIFSTNNINDLMEDLL